MKRPSAIEKRTPPPNRPPDYSIQWEDYCILDGQEPPRGAFAVGETVLFQPEPENPADKTAVRFVNRRGIRGGYLYRSNHKEAIFDALGRGAIVTGTIKECNKWGMAGSVDIWTEPVSGYYSPRKLGGIGPDIVSARSRAGMTQAALASQLGVSARKLSALESAKMLYYPAELIRQIASITGTTPEGLGCRDATQAPTEAPSTAVRTSPAPSAGRIQPVACRQAGQSAGPDVGNRLTIRREPAAAYGARAVRVLVDGTELRRLANGGTCSTELPSGAHTVELYIGRRAIGTQQVNIAASVDVTMLFTIAATGTAAIQITQISTAPVADGSWVPTQPQTGGEVYEARSRGNGALLRLLLVIAIIWVLWVVLSNLTITISLVPTFE